MRDDKGIIDFVKNNNLEKLILTIAGKVNSKSMIQLMKNKNLKIKIQKQIF